MQDPISSSHVDQLARQLLYLPSRSNLGEIQNPPKPPYTTGEPLLMQRIANTDWVWLTPGSLNSLVRRNW